MHVLAWVAFIGFMINAGSILVSTGVSLVNGEAAKNLYQGLDLHHLSEMNWIYYTWAVSLMVAIPVMKAMIWLLVIRILSVLTPEDPFKMEVAQKLERISYLLLGTWSWEWLATSNILGCEITGELPVLPSLRNSFSWRDWCSSFPRSLSAAWKSNPKTIDRITYADHCQP